MSWQRIWDVKVSRADGSVKNGTVVGGRDEKRRVENRVVEIGTGIDTIVVNTILKHYILIVLKGVVVNGVNSIVDAGNTLGNVVADPIGVHGVSQTGASGKIAPSSEAVAVSVAELSSSHHMSAAPATASSEAQSSLSSSSTSLKNSLATLRASSSRAVTALEAVLLTGDAGGSEPLDMARSRAKSEKMFMAQQSTRSRHS
ncbi:unnamed protein product [Hyaloperonospora brassicae]|uniref:RxLR effector candidate protein n=1 Tax=Hyaloperonospora brassicae TaxID=162125 RepID=A0AAV0TLQ7_HYABA|nr:unnamed protein product [Hyaloperonospora brassicae]